MILVNEGGSDIRSTPADLERDLKVGSCFLDKSRPADIR